MRAVEKCTSRPFEVAFICRGAYFIHFGQGIKVSKHATQASTPHSCPGLRRIIITDRNDTKTRASDSTSTFHILENCDNGYTGEWINLWVSLGGSVHLSENAYELLNLVVTMTLLGFNVHEHVILCQHIRGYRHATKNATAGLRLAIKEYVPKESVKSAGTPITIIATHANGISKVMIYQAM